MNSTPKQTKELMRDSSLAKKKNLISDQEKCRLCQKRVERKDKGISCDIVTSGITQYALR